MFANAVEDGGCGHPLAFTLVCGDVEALGEVHLLWGAELEHAVHLHHLERLLLIEPVGNALAEQGYGLGVELTMVDVATHVDGTCEFDAYEAAAARGVCEQVGDVGGGDEGCSTGETLDVLSVWRLHLYGRKLHYIFEESFLHFRAYLVELVEVDEQELAHSL